uniref:Uncharacterized protein n=1 Tax=Anguilla anguilla TaxID=7936 RepID=A0A0E9W932_ANGAN
MRRRFRVNQIHSLVLHSVVREVISGQSALPVRRLRTSSLFFASFPFPSL